MNKIIIFVILLVGAQLSNAQGYRLAGGIRLGTEIGLTAKQKVWDNTTIEGIFQSKVKTDEINFTFLYARHYNLIFKRINFYLGLGAHKGWNTSTSETYGDPSGVTGIAGAEITLGKVNISWDYKPAVNIWGGDQLFESQTGLSLRYVFIKKKKKKINWRFWERDPQKQKEREKRKKKRKKEKAKKKKKRNRS